MSLPNRILPVPTRLVSARTIDMLKSASGGPLLYVLLIRLCDECVEDLK
jgi:hypothetical protein